MSEPRRIPQANPGAQYRAHAPQLQAAIGRVLTSGYYVLGPEVAAFEDEFAGYLGVEHAVGVGSGTDAIHLGLRALGVGPGDEVIAPTHTAVATVAAIEMAGATVVLVDAAPASFNLDPAAAAAAIGPRTAAIVAVHLYGHPAPMDALRALADRHGVMLIEDCAQAAGARHGKDRVGALGDLAAFSFYPTKNLAAFGDGGLVATSRRDVAERLRRLRAYGWKERNVSEFPGWNSRLDELQAAVLRTRLGWLDDDNRRRRQLAHRMTEHLPARLETPTEALPCEHVYHLYVVRCDRRDDLGVHLGRCGIGTAVHYPRPVHLQPAYVDRLGRPGQFPLAEAIAAEILSLPMYPELTDAEVDAVIAAMTEFVGASTGSSR